jgi:hypothetical protein
MADRQKVLDKCADFADYSSADDYDAFTATAS